MSELELQPVTSTNVAAVGYNPTSRVMRVAFQSGGVYDYFDVDPALFEQMLTPYPWRRVGAAVMVHSYVRVAA